jgi:glucose-1-phosphate cytidylyltransferase
VITTPEDRADIPVVILCGGMGTRLREETERLPKPLIEIGPRPILWHIMKLYSFYGFRRFILCLGYKGWLIKDYFLSYRAHAADFTIRLQGKHEPQFYQPSGDEDWEVTCAETGLLSGTGARLRLVRDYIDSDTFMFTYGDGLGVVDLGRLLDFHLGHQLLGTVTGVHPTSRYGELGVVGTEVVEFNEKPTTAEGLVSAGFFVFQRPFLDRLDDDPDLLIERKPLQELARAGQLAVFRHEGFWMGMDTYRELTALNELWESGHAPWKVWDD